MSLPLSIRLIFITLLLTWSSALCLAQEPSKEVLAEQAADRIVKRFYETLDFGESDKPESLDSLKELFSDAEVKQSDFWYVARRGRFFLYLVEEAGEFRMLSYKSRVRF